MQVQPGSMLGGYTVVQPLGAGSAGTMFLARRPGGAGELPIEVMPAAWAEVPAIRAAVEQSARYSGVNNHPCVAPVFDRCMPADPVLWLALRPIPAGSSVSAVGNRPARMEPDRAIRIVEQLAGALDYAHERGIVHGNVTPAAILVQRDESGERALLSGFGLARRLEPAGAGQVADLGCTAPERWTPGAVLGAGADVYSLGCTLFQLLTGVPVVSGDDPGAVGAAHRYAPPPSPRELRPDLPAALDTVIATALAKEPADRYATCGQLAAAARQALDAAMPSAPGLAPARPDAQPASSAQPASAALPDFSAQEDSLTQPNSDGLPSAATDFAALGDLAAQRRVSAHPPGPGRGEKIAVIALVTAAVGTVVAVSAAAAGIRPATEDHPAAAAPVASTTAAPAPAKPLLPSPNPRPATVDCSYHAAPAAVPGITQPATAGISTAGTAQVALDTGQGPMSLTLDRSEAPCTVDSFLNLVAQNYFDNSPCHRLTDAPSLKVLQCGDPTGKGTGTPGYEFANEYPSDQIAPDNPNAGQPVTYSRGVVAMANSDRPGMPTEGTNGSQFFLVIGDSELPPDYTVFGTVDPTGLATLDRIAAAGTADASQDGAPANPVVIATARAQ
ncbi:peptidylprolyl isomerase [Nocardia stercoris]|uniref:non-specific serine/threonine protein kinase n=1 Tax=Nocardia stercoris TaxID=2483361 RepID=A0A3M2KZA6_9NOCA|nr:peptidylprolyl isomerase [Nocardia stercoris]RMI30621.1 hypothetical protein EBN03_21400 [Nocardia stercoris]